MVFNRHRFERNCVAVSYCFRPAKNIILGAIWGWKVQFDALWIATQPTQSTFSPKKKRNKSEEKKHFRQQGLENFELVAASAFAFAEGEWG